jgi:hypothetical protein
LQLQEGLPEGTAVSAHAAKRPVAVTFVAALALIVGAYHAGHGIAVLVDGGTASKLAEGSFDLALGGLAVAIGVGVLRMRRWAWAAFMTWAVVGLTHQLLRHFFYDNPDYLAMALDTVAVLALTPLDVQVAFGVRPPRTIVLERATRNPSDLG